MRCLALLLSTAWALSIDLRAPAHAQAPQVAPVNQQAESAPWPTDGRGGVVAPAPTTQPPPSPPLDPQLALRYELLLVEHELDRLRAARPRLFWPISMVAVGGGMAGLSSLIALTVWGTSRSRRYGWDEQGNRYESTYVDKDARAGAREPAIFAVIGLGLAAGGLALLIPRVRVRRQLKQQVKPLRERRQELIRSLAYSLNVSDQRPSVSASFRF